MRTALENPEPEAMARYEQSRLEERLRKIADRDPGRAEKLRSDWENKYQAGKIRRSDEYGSLIIHSMETNTPRVVYGNVSNDGLIENLPVGCCVEVPCLVDKNG